MKTILKFTDASIARATGDLVLNHLNWSVHENEPAGISGDSGSGKSTLAGAICGRHRVVHGAIDRFVQKIECVSFREQSHLFSHARHYYQQRFNFIEPEDDLKLIDFLGGDRSLLGSYPEKLHIEGLLNQSLIQLSNGQLRRARLCKALAAQPELLILDDPFMGIDSGGRVELSNLLHSLIRGGLQLILIAKPEEMPDWVTNRLTLGGSESPRISIQDRPPHELRATSTSESVIELNDVSIRYGEKFLLQQINWRVNRGDRWGLLGPNGSGKSTLLSLIVGDHPQVYSNDVRLFGTRRGQGESIWEVKARIGFVSPELHLYFSEPLLSWEVVASGFFDVLVRRRVDAAQEQRLKELFADFEITPLWNRPFRHLATGQQRLLLFLRAGVKCPELLILDEPFQGLDSATIERIRRWLDTELTPEQTLIFVTHYLHEMPRSVHSILRLEQGRIVR